MNRASTTPARILDAAEELFAAHGIDATPVSAILEHAGARNKSAIAYHFGSKLGVLQALVERHWQVIDAHRDRVLDEVEAAGPTLGGLVRAMVEPVAARLDDPSGVRYVQIQAALLGSPRRDLLPDDLRDPARRLHRLNRLMREVAPPDPAPEATRTLVLSLVFHGLADFSRSQPTVAERDAFVSALVSAVRAILERDGAAPS